MVVSDRIPDRGIATDAAHSAKSKLTLYRAVDLETGEELFCEEAGNLTANAGEFLGVAAAVRYIIETNHSPRTIYTDSSTAKAWYDNRTTASRKNIPSLRKAEAFLRFLALETDSIRVELWDNKRFGEIPADFGNK